MSATIQIDRDEFAPWRSSELNGVNIETRLSPYDVPEEVRLRIVIEKGQETTQLVFVYLTPERRLEDESLSDGSVVTFGINSRRIYGLAIKRPANATRLATQELATVFGDMVDRWRSSDGRNRSAHYDLIKVVIANVLGKVDLEQARAELHSK